MFRTLLKRFPIKPHDVIDPIKRCGVIGEHCSICLKENFCGMSLLLEYGEEEAGIPIGKL